MSEIEPEPIPKSEPELVSEIEPEPIPKSEPELVSETEPEPMPEIKPERMLEPEIKPTPEPVPEPTSTLTKVTTEELCLAYREDKIAADKKFTDKILEVTGVVDRVVVNDIHDIYYVILASAEGRREWHIRCTFDKKQAPELNRLTAGQVVTVQGKYDGYKINILMRDCALLR